MASGAFGLRLSAFGFSRSDFPGGPGWATRACTWSSSMAATTPGRCGGTCAPGCPRWETVWEGSVSACGGCGPSKKVRVAVDHSGCKSVATSVIQVGIPSFFGG